VFQIVVCANAERNPSRIRNPPVLFSKTFRQERIMNWASKRNINYAASVNVSDFCLSEKKFPSAKAMRVN